MLNIKLSVKKKISCFVICIVTLVFGCTYNERTNKLNLIKRSSWDIGYLIKNENTSFVTNRLKIIIIHHSAFLQKPGPLEIQEYQIHKMGYDEIAYHFIIADNGDIYEGRSINVMGAHAGQTEEANELADSIRKGLVDKPLVEALKKDPDFGSIGICLDGNFEFEKTSSTQLKSLSLLLQRLVEKYNIKKDKIILHKDVRKKIIENNGLTPIGEATKCPGKHSYEAIMSIVHSL
ncbi:MAG: hypothetical protein GY932_04490 [Arcobacter sp.]|nr:hypothetical protein [Arcobacter sp.]